MNLRRGEGALAGEQKRRGRDSRATHVGGIDLALNNVENRDVAGRAVRDRGARDETVLGLEEASHHVEDGRLPHRLGLKKKGK